MHLAGRRRHGAFVHACAVTRGVDVASVPEAGGRYAEIVDSPIPSEAGPIAYQHLDQRPSYGGAAIPIANTP